jgi:hypothetical protein
MLCFKLYQRKHCKKNDEMAVERTALNKKFMQLKQEGLLDQYRKNDQLEQIQKNVRSK